MIQDLITPADIARGKREEERNEKMNLMNSAHKSSNDAYRDGWDRIWGKKKPMFEWYGYVHVNGTVHLKRYFSALQEGDINEAIESDFVVKVVGPFEAENREAAMKYLKEKLND